MKDNISIYVRELTIFVVLFGLWCLLRAVVCTFFFSHSDIPPDGLKYLSDDTISVIEQARYGLIASIVGYTFVVLVSGVSAYGIIKRKIWGRRVWTISSIVLFIYFSLASWMDSSSFLFHIPGFILCFFSWYVLWYLPRNKKQIDSFNEIADGNEW